MYCTHSAEADSTESPLFSLSATLNIDFNAYQKLVEYNASRNRDYLSNQLIVNKRRGLLEKRSVDNQTNISKVIVWI